MKQCYMHASRSMKYFFTYFIANPYLRSSILQKCLFRYSKVSEINTFADKHDLNYSKSSAITVNNCKLAIIGRTRNSEAGYENAFAWRRQNGAGLAGAKIFPLAPFKRHISLTYSRKLQPYNYVIRLTFHQHDFGYFQYRLFIKPARFRLLKYTSKGF